MYPIRMHNCYASTKYPYEKTNSRDSFRMILSLNGYTMFLYVNLFGWFKTTLKNILSACTLVL